MDLHTIPSALGARWAGGLMNNDSVLNPLTTTWNAVWVHYCSGGSYSGNNETVTYTTYNKKMVPLYFRGQRVLEAILQDLEDNYGLKEATDVVLSGDSAGGLATYWHADMFSERYASHATVAAAPDSGYFLGLRGVDFWRESLAGMAEMMNSTLDQSCSQAAAKTGKSRFEACTLPEDVSPYITTPLFAMNSRFDPALDGICGHIDSSNTKAVNDAGLQVLQSINATVLNRPGNWAFITACHEHCGQWGQNQTLGPNGQFNDFNVTIRGHTGATAFAKWYTTIQSHKLHHTALPPPQLWLQPDLYPCETCCQGGGSG